MAKTNLSPLRKSAERLKDVRLKDAHFQLIDLNIFQRQAIEGRKNPVNGRYVAALNVKAAILDMYPNILAPITSKPREVINPSPITPLAAPKVAPPPIIQEMPKPETTVDNVVYMDAYREAKATKQETTTITQPDSAKETSPELEQAAMLAKSRADIESIYNGGEKTRQSKVA